MAAVSYVKMKFGFADETNRDFEMGPFATSALSGAKAAIKSLKNDLSPIATKYVSTGGASCVSILDAYIITENVTEINLN